ncbi:MAG: endonuclease/exonuclease/phosphatase family protein [Bacteroidota bacterium]
MKAIRKVTLWGVGLLVLYIGGILVFGTLTDWVPDPVMTTTVENSEAAVPEISDSNLTFLIWNVGYGGLGAEEAFFYDQGDFFWTDLGHVRVSQARVEENVDGQEGTVTAFPADFYLLQEVDTSSRRSWYTHQMDSIMARKPKHAASFAMNFRNERVPIPIFQMWDHYGYVRGGLLSLSQFAPRKSERYQLPGDLAWPTRLFELDRCVLRQTFPTSWGKELVVYNIHLAAYDKGGVVKKQQMDWLRTQMIKDYEAGYYVVIGGDWNQVPPGFDYGRFSPERRNEYSQIAIDFEYAPEGWSYAYDPTTPTNRKAHEVYSDDALKTLIDFYLVSPNVKLKKVRGVNQSFAYSDHQPVILNIELIK